MANSLMAPESAKKRRAGDDWRLRTLIQLGALGVLMAFGWLYFQSETIKAEQTHQQMLSLIEACNDGRDKLSFLDSFDEQPR